MEIFNKESKSKKIKKWKKKTKHYKINQQSKTDTCKTF